MHIGFDGDEAILLSLDTSVDKLWHKFSKEYSTKQSKKDGLNYYNNRRRA